eukprot:GHVT01067094.1.p1 GENE.GHVT01067094.1~~GHVT01067094.1.p1  ORF type:complete len:881 (+),score=28.01 GHVT01067094.1:93-2735(+)
MAALRVRVQSKNGRHLVDQLTGDSTLDELKTVIEKLTNIPKQALKIMKGFPPKQVETSDNLCSLSSLDIRSGDTLIVEEDARVMATAGSIESDVKEEFECVVCKDVYDNPRQLPCQHVFCKHCLELEVKNNTISCPLCRAEHSVPDTGIDTYPPAYDPNITPELEKIIENLARDPMCKKHSQESITHVCPESYDLFCKQCPGLNGKVDLSLLMTKYRYKLVKQMDEMESLKHYEEERVQNLQIASNFGKKTRDNAKCTLRMLQEVLKREQQEVLEREKNHRLQKYGVHAVALFLKIQFDCHSEEKQINQSEVISSRLNEYMDKFQKCLTTGSRSEVLQMCSEATTHLDELKELGIPEPITHRSVQNHELYDPVELGFENTKKFPVDFEPSGIICLPDGNKLIIVCQRDNTTITVFTSDGMKIGDLKTVDERTWFPDSETYTEAFDVGVTQSTPVTPPRLYVTDRNTKSVKMYEIDYSTKFEQIDCKEIDCKKIHGSGLDMYRDTAFITSSGSNQVFTAKIQKDGTFSTLLPFAEQLNFKNPEYVCANKNHVAISSKSSHCVLVTDFGGSLYHAQGIEKKPGKGDQHLNRPYGVALDGRYLLIADKKNNRVCIVCLSERRQIGAIDVTQNGFSHPTAITINPEGNLLVTCCKCNEDRQAQYFVVEYKYSIKTSSSTISSINVNKFVKQKTQVAHRDDESRCANLVFYGLEEDADKTGEDAKQKVRDICRDKFGVIVPGDCIKRAYRVRCKQTQVPVDDNTGVDDQPHGEDGANSSDSKKGRRPILCKFSSWKTRANVLEAVGIKARERRENGLQPPPDLPKVVGDYSIEMRAHRKKMIAHWIENKGQAKNEGDIPDGLCLISHDMLVIHGTPYVFNEENEL